MSLTRNRTILGVAALVVTFVVAFLVIPDEAVLAPEEEPSVRLEAFAYGTLCFADIDADADGVKDFSGWGWSIGPLSKDVYPYIFPLYLGPAGCDASGGTLVGAVDISYDGKEAALVYSMIPGYELDSAHVYVGSERMPRDPAGRFTATPSEFPVADQVTENRSRWVKRVNGLSGDIYVVAQAVLRKTP